MDIRTLDAEKDIDEVLTLLSSSLTHPGQKDWFEWKHLSNPFGASDGLVAVDNNKIVGVRLFMNWEFKQGSNTIFALRPVDTATHPDARGKGIFKELTLKGLSIYNSANDKVIFNTPNSNSLPGYLKMGWRKLGQSFSYSYFLINILKRTRSIREHINFDGLDVDRAPSELIQTNKTRAFLNWRYQDKRYKIASFSDDLNSFLVYQLLLIKGLKVLAIKDYCGASVNFMPLVTSLAKQNNIFIGYCVNLPSLFSVEGISKLKRGNSIVVYKGPEIFRDATWQFSPGDLEGIL